MQTKITSRHHDGSIRHLFVRFEADLPANKGTAIDILPNSSESSCIKPEQPCSLLETGDGFLVSTNALSFVVKNGSAHLFESVQTNETTYHSESFLGPTCRDHNGNLYNATYDEWQVVENGPLCVILSCKGFLVSNVRRLPLEIRVTAYRQKPWLDLAFRVINATSDAICLSDYVFEVLGNPQSSPCRTCVASSNYRTNYHANEAGEEVSLEIDADWLKNGEMNILQKFFMAPFSQISLPRMPGLQARSIRHIKIFQRV